MVSVFWLCSVAGSSHSTSSMRPANMHSIALQNKSIAQSGSNKLIHQPKQMAKMMAPSTIDHNNNHHNDDYSASANCQPQPTLVLQGVSKELDFATIMDQLCEKNNLKKESILQYFKVVKSEQVQEHRATEDICFKVTFETFQKIANKKFKLAIGERQYRLRRQLYID